MTQNTKGADKGQRVDVEAPSGGKDVLVVSAACVLFLFAQFAVTSLLLLCRVPVTWANAAISLLVAIAFVAKEADRKILAVAITFSLIAASVALASFYYDGSWDGNVYHKLGAGLIKAGWNPIYHTFGDYANNSGKFLQTAWAGIYDGYPKASYIIAANLYAATETIESGKAYTAVHDRRDWKHHRFLEKKSAGFGGGRASSSLFSCAPTPCPYMRFSRSTTMRSSRC